jgi:formate dehydrogenase subunit delta
MTTKAPQARMANEIAVQFHHRPVPEAAQAIATHIRRFWDPRMLDQLREHAETEPDELDPLVVEAVKLLK